MATYVPGVGSYLPDFKPFTPDYKFLSNVLDTKTQRYNTNYKALNDLYGKVVYGNLSRKDTQEMRNQYAENLAPKLQQISGMDLSMAQNVDAAKALFQPFFQEDLIVKDLVQTRKYRNEMQYADMLKNSAVDEERRKWWQTGVQKMQYEMEDFVNASQDKALGMSLPQYVANSNLYEKAMQYLTDSELGTGLITEISEDGMWKIQRQNGELITNEALTMVQKALKDDPMVIQAYHADAFVKSRQFADKGIEEGIYSSVDQGQNAWAQSKIKEIEAEIEKRQNELKKQKRKQEEKTKAWEKTKNQRGVIKDSEEEKVMNEASSEFKAIEEKLKDINQLYDDQPQSEIDFKTTGEYKPQDTQSLLYRAYSLLMNYGMETDLQAAALDYSKKDMVLNFEATELQKYKYNVKMEQLKHNNSLAQMQRKAELQMAVDAAKIKAEMQASGQNLLQGLGEATRTTEKNTVTGVYRDENGKWVGFDDYDYAQSQLKFADGAQQKIQEQKIDVALDVLRRKQQQTNGGSGLITIEGLGTKSVDEFKKEFNTILSSSYGDKEVQKKYQEAWDKTYNETRSLVEGINPKTNTFSDGSPIMLGSENPAEEFSQIQNAFIDLDGQESLLQANIEKLYKTIDNNLKQGLLQSRFNLDKGDEFVELMQKAVGKGMPIPTYTDSNGVVRMRDLDEYIVAYNDWILAGGGKGLSVEDVTGAAGFDDTGYFTLDKYEQAWSDASNRMADLGEGAAADGKALKSWGDAFTISRTPPETVNTYNGVMGYSKERSDLQAKAFYEAMMDISNLAIKGKLEYNDAVQDKKGNKIEGDRLFQVWDIKQGMMGVPGSKQNAGEIANNPSYTVMLDPLNVSPDSAEFLKLIDGHVQNGEGTMFLAPVGFNRLQEDETSWYNVQDDDEEMLDPNDMGSNLDEEQLRLSRLVYDQYIMDLTKRRTTDSKSQTGYPTAKITYFTSWTSDGDRLDSPYSGYTIQLSDDYMSTLRKKGGILEGKEAFGNTISLVINSATEDKNPRKYGEFNFSYVASEIAISDDASFKKAVPSGGSFSITSGADGGYNINYDLLQFNEGEWKNASFTKAMVNADGIPLTQANRSELDFYMKEYLYQLQKIGEHNNKAQSAWKKSHPQAVIGAPEYAFGEI